MCVGDACETRPTTISIRVYIYRICKRRLGHRWMVKAFEKSELAMGIGFEASLYGGRISLSLSPLVWKQWATVNYTPIMGDTRNNCFCAPTFALDQTWFICIETHIRRILFIYSWCRWALARKANNIMIYIMEKKLCGYILKNFV